MCQQSSSSTYSKRSDGANAQGMVEYALIIALVGVFAIAGLTQIGPSVSSLLNSLAASIQPG